MSRKALIILLCFLTSCKWGIDLEYSQLLPKGNWRGSISSPIGELPFLFGLEMKDSLIIGEIFDQGEQLDFVEVKCVDDSLFISLGDIRMRFRIAGIQADSLLGEISRNGINWVECEAKYAEKYKFISKSRSFSSSLNGRWQLKLDDGDSVFLDFEEGATDLFVDNINYKMWPDKLSGIKDSKNILLSGISNEGYLILKGALQDSILSGEGWDGNSFNWVAKRISRD